MTTPDLERVLDTLLHDLRSPLGVVSGYARLLRQGRVTDPAEVDRLLARMQDALRAMSSLCADVSTWRDPEPLERPFEIPVNDFASAVADRLAEADVLIHRETAGGELILRDQPDRVAAAVATVLAAAATARMKRVSVTIHVADGVLRFDADDPGGHAGPQPFDPWQYGGLHVPLACRTIARAGGRGPIVTVADAAVSIGFDIERMEGDDR